MRTGDFVEHMQSTPTNLGTEGTGLTRPDTVERSPDMVKSNTLNLVRKNNSSRYCDVSDLTVIIMSRRSFHAFVPRFPYREDRCQPPEGYVFASPTEWTSTSSSIAHRCRLSVPECGTETKSTEPR